MELGEMGTYVELSQVKTWYDERGAGEPLVLLHGGVVDTRFFEPNIDALAARFRVFALELRGHGHTPDVEGPYTYDALAHGPAGADADRVRPRPLALPAAARRTRAPRCRR